MSIATTAFIKISTVKPNSWSNPIKISPFVHAYGTQLFLFGKPYQFVGVNAYSLASLQGVNAGCGGEVGNLDTFFSSLRLGSLVRFWAFQASSATNIQTKQLDWTALDSVIASASRNQIKLIVVLGNQSGTCDDNMWKDVSWYTHGFTQASTDSKGSNTSLSYLEYVRQVVSRYKDSTTIAMWEPINEPEASDCTNEQGSACYTHQVCTNEVISAKALRSFFDSIGSLIHSIDRNHLVSSGTLGTGQCGTVYQDYAFVHKSPGIDIASYHDYGDDNSSMPGDHWNGLSYRLKQLKIIQKPLYIGEVGVLASDSGQGCSTLLSREEKVKAKMDAQFKAGIVGFVPWDYTRGTTPTCNFDIGARDPTLSLLSSYPVQIQFAK